jgi:hypothetical protein
MPDESPMALFLLSAPRARAPQPDSPVVVGSGKGEVQMASIHRETVVGVGAEQAWAALRTVGAPHELFAPVLTDGELNGETRRVTFANGMVVNERIVDVDDGMRRVAYSVIDAPGVRYHHASMQVREEGPDRCRFVWITDFLPADAAAALTPLIEAGSAALKTNLEAGKPVTAATQVP